MRTGVTASILLEGWPPPLIEPHALVAALKASGVDQDGAPPTAYQHLNEVVVTFEFSPHHRTADDARAQQIAHSAMAKIYDGAVTVRVELTKLRHRQVDVRPLDLEMRRRPRADTV